MRQKYVYNLIIPNFYYFFCNYNGKFSKYCIFLHIKQKRLRTNVQSQMYISNKDNGLEPLGVSEVHAMWQQVVLWEHTEAELVSTCILDWVLDSESNKAALALNNLHLH